MNAGGPHFCVGDCRRAEAEIARLREELDQTRYERDHYRRETCNLVESDRTVVIEQEFGLTAEESLVCNALYQRREKWLPGGNIEDLLDEYRGGANEASLVSQLVSRIRRKLGETAVENRRGHGYRLSTVQLRKFDRKLRK